MDFPLITYFAPRSLASFTIYSLASSAVRAQNTFAPLAMAFFSNSSRRSGSRDSASERIAAPH
ncbi:MAG: hypothetical protein ACD_87C00258G0001, partial [uncultured bacterium]